MGTHYQGPKAEVDALNAYIKLMRAAETVTARTMAALPASLTISQFGVLETLLHRGPMCQTELAGKLLKSGGNITLVVDNLEKAGWVIRQRDASDRRFVTVSLTEAGRAFIRELFPKVAASIAREFAALSTAEQFTLGWLCKRLGTYTAPAQASDLAAFTNFLQNR
ncbi:MAG: MarR family winged helix-turn-helix transcriptional regulator [Opitutales bacterium]